MAQVHVTELTHTKSDLDCWQCMQHSITDNLAPNRVQHVCVQIRTDMNCVQQETDTNCKLRTRLQEPGPQSAQFLSDKIVLLAKDFCMQCWATSRQHMMHQRKRETCICHPSISLTWMQKTLGGRHDVIRACSVDFWGSFLSLPYRRTMWAL